MSVVSELFREVRNRDDFIGPAHVESRAPAKGEPLHGLEVVGKNFEGYVVDGQHEGGAHLGRSDVLEVGHILAIARQLERKCDRDTGMTLVWSDPA